MKVMNRNSLIKIILFLICITSSQIYAFSQKKGTIEKKSTGTEDVQVFELNENDYFLEGIRRYNMSEYDKALELFSKVLEFNPSNDAAYFYTGMIYYAQKDIDKAELNLREACKLDSRNYWYHISLAELYAGSQRIDAALSIFEDLLEKYPMKSSIYYQLIEFYTQNRQLDEALDVLAKLEKVKGKNEATVNYRYELLALNGKNAEADSLLVSISEEYPSARVFYLLGDSYKSKYNDTLAIKYYQKALNEDVHFAPAYLGLAETYRYRRQFDLFFKNLNVFMLSKEMDPKLKIGYLSQTVFTPQFVQAFKPQVDTLVENLLIAHPADSTTLSTAGAYFIQSDQPERGREIYKLNATLYPESYAANLEYISLLFHFEEWNTLIPVVLKSLESFPGDLGLTEILAVSYWRNNNLNEAVKVYEMILSKVKKDDPILLNCYASLGDLHQSQGNSRKAFSYYKKALKIDPDFNPVLNNYAYYLSLSGKSLKKAYQMSRKTINTEPDNPTYLDTYGWILHLLGANEEAEDQYKHAMLYGGRDSAVILDHYAEVLFALKKYDLAFIYWEQADKKDPSLGIPAKMERKKEEMKKNNGK